jgi:acetyltransferase-like isoleucine patch superfamily enzyme
MKDILKKILYRLLLLIERKTASAHIYYNLKYILAGEGSKIYSETVIHNIKGDPNLIKLGKNTHVHGELLVLNYGGKIEIGDYCFIGQNCRIWSGDSIKIGSNVFVSHNVNIIDTNSHEINPLEREQSYLTYLSRGFPSDKGSIKTSPIIIEDSVWISFNCTVLPGVTIGRGAIIGANSVVTKSIPPFTIAVGNPAKVKRVLKENETGGLLS